jgi:cytochrome c oxidase assembly protein subunit 11
MNPNIRLAFNLGALVAGMVMLAYASVPLYQLFCAVTGYGGTTQRAVALPGSVSERVITVEFNADIDPGLPWDFAPGERRRTVKVGEQGLTHYVAKNLTDKPVGGHAVYNVVPFKAGQYFTKIHCFCFENQTLGANQQVDMPVSFFIDPAMLSDPEMKDVHTITLSYTFFPLKQ